MSQPQFDENNPGYFHADKTNQFCSSPFCSNRLSGENISNGEDYCSDECYNDHNAGSDIVLFDSPFDSEESDEDEELTED